MLPRECFSGCPVQQPVMCKRDRSILIDAQPTGGVQSRDTVVKKSELVPLLSWQRLRLPIHKGASESGCEAFISKAALGRNTSPKALEYLIFASRCPLH